MVSFEDLLAKKSSVAVVGLGYVGLPLAVALSHHFDVIGFDINVASRASPQTLAGPRRRQKLHVSGNGLRPAV